jgi:hypothetical protein
MQRIRYQGHRARTHGVGPTAEVSTAQLARRLPDIATRIVRELGFNSARLLFAVLKLPQGH